MGLLELMRQKQSYVFSVFSWSMVGVDAAKTILCIFCVFLVNLLKSTGPVFTMHLESLTSKNSGLKSMFIPRCRCVFVAVLVARFFSIILSMVAYLQLFISHNLNKTTHFNL